VFIRRPGDIGLVVKAARKARAMSQADLAKRLGVSRLWINEFEGGKPTARLDLVLRALAELDIKLTAQTGDKVRTEDLVETPSDIIDIDAIADTGLARETPREAPRMPQSSRRRR
jgi:transcriptional regulator with XRE-family HTH domain